MIIAFEIPRAGGVETKDNRLKSFWEWALDWGLENEMLVDDLQETGTRLDPTMSPGGGDTI